MTQRDEKIKVRLVDQQSWIQGHTNDEIKSAQRNDTALQIIIKWLEYQDKLDNELFLMSKAAKAYWINKELFILDQDGLLWKQDEGTKVLVLPSTMIAEVMNLCHDVPSTGHQGVSRTLSRVGLRSDFTGIPCQQMFRTMLLRVPSVIEIKNQKDEIVAA